MRTQQVPCGCGACRAAASSLHRSCAQDLALPNRDKVLKAWNPRVVPVRFGKANSFFSHFDAARSALCASTLRSISLSPSAFASAG